MNAQLDSSAMDLIFDNVSVGRPVTSFMVARASLALKGHVENYLKIEKWIMSMGYEKRMSELKVTYVKSVTQTGGVPQ